MRIENEKTGIVYAVETRKRSQSFTGLVVEYDKAKHSARIVNITTKHETRSKAHSAASKLCKTRAANHAFIN